MVPRFHPKPPPNLCMPKKFQLSEKMLRHWQWFKQSGFESRGGGKIYHPNKPKNNDQPFSWDFYYKANGDDQVDYLHVDKHHANKIGKYQLATPAIHPRQHVKPVPALCESIVNDWQRDHSLSCCLSVVAHDHFIRSRVHCAHFIGSRVDISNWQNAQKQSCWSD